MNVTYLLSIRSLDHWRRLSLQTTLLDKKTEVFKPSQNFTEGKTRKVSACFFRLHVCDVIKFRDHHERMRSRGPRTVASSAPDVIRAISELVSPQSKNNRESMRQNAIIKFIHSYPNFNSSKIPSFRRKWYCVHVGEY